jgi:hypothetical protein
MALSYDRYQQVTVDTLADAGVCMDLGAGNSFDPSALPDLLTGFESDRMKRQAFSTKGRKIIDGGGFERVARIIRESLGARSNPSLLEGVG